MKIFTRRYFLTFCLLLTFPKILLLEFKDKNKIIIKNGWLLREKDI